jgi:hypothetical protein
MMHPERKKKRHAGTRRSTLPLEVQLNRLLQEQDAGFVGNDPRRQYVRRAIAKIRRRIRGMDPMYGAVGDGSTHVPSSKRDEYRMRCAVRDIKGMLDKT